jgi:hypothetical protein
MMDARGPRGRTTQAQAVHRAVLVAAVLAVFVPDGPSTAAAQAGPWTREPAVEGAFDLPPGAPSVLVHAPPAFDGAGPLQLVVFLHGWNGCVRVLAQSGEVACRAAEAARGGLGPRRPLRRGRRRCALGDPAARLPSPQRRSRRLRDPRSTGGLPRRGRVRPRPRRCVQAPAIVLAHSAGFEAALSFRSTAGAIVLFDALYRGVDPFADWLVADRRRRLWTIHVGRGRPARQSARLMTVLRERVPDDARLEGAYEDLVASWPRLVSARTRLPHGEVPSRILADVLRRLL